MKRKIISICILLSMITPFIKAQHAIGSWQSYLSYHHVTRTEPAGNLVYAIGNGGLFAYDKEDSSIQCYWKNNLLNDTDISYIAYNNEYKALIIIYSNANIDLLINNETLYNIPDYMNKNMAGNKNVNHICFANEYAYLSTSFGVLILNLKRKEITNTYILNKAIDACAVDNEKVYAASSEGLFTGILTDNLLDVNNWKRVSTTAYNSLSMYNSNLIGSTPHDGIHLINKLDYSYSQLVNGDYSFMYAYDNKLLAGNNNSLVIFDSLDKHHRINHNLNIAYLSYKSGNYWAAGLNKGVIGLKYNETNNTMENVVSDIIPNSPKRNLPYYLKFADERLLIAGGGLTNLKLNNPGTIMMLENNTWSSFEEEGIGEKIGRTYQDITSIAQDPRDDKHHFASSAGDGLYEFYDKKFVKRYGLDNSTLESALPNESYKDYYVKTNGLIYDENSNLWILNSSDNNQIHIIDKNNKWIPLHHDEIGNQTNFEHQFFDKRGWIWAASTYFSHSKVFCTDTNGTLANASDDKCRAFRNFTNQDGTELNYLYYCITEDREGAIWIGTDRGPLVLNNPSKAFDTNFYCTQIKVPRNDDTNLADFLLNNEAIKTIAVDAANRKWMGTSSNGLYLISADGMETIHHFTQENSSLPSNSITSLAIHPRTGEVFIGTNKGLVSYQSDATEPSENFNDDSVYAYPNPVKPDYTGVITVTGLMLDTNVKITNANGKLIHTGTSIGGQFTWNGLNAQGSRVPSGIYFVLAADKDGKQGIATKILFIK